MGDQAERLNRFAEAIGLKKFHIVGNSMGGHMFIKRPLVEEAQRHKESNQRIFEKVRRENSDLEPDLGKIRVPTLILWGGRDRVIDVSAVEVFRKGIPESTSVIMENCGHLPMIERPQESARHYWSFLKKG